MFIHGETLSAHSNRPPKIPGWMVIVREFFFCEHVGLQKITIVIALRGFCHFAFSNFSFAFGFHGFHLTEKLKIIQYIFELVRGRKFIDEQ